VLYGFGEYTLDTDRRELKSAGRLVSLEPQVFDLIVYLVENRHRVVCQDDLLDAVWGGRIVSKSTLTTRINAARKAIGDSGAQQSLIRTVMRKGVRFVASVTELDGHKEPARPPTPAAPVPRQRIQFARSADGIRIAWASVGSGPALVKPPNFLNHLEHDWEFPIQGPLLRVIAADFRLIRHDARGSGLSDRDPGCISFDAFVNDLGTVIDAAGIERCALLGMSHGCAIAIAYAARHPERVSHLVLCGGFARGGRRVGSAQLTEQADALLTLMRAGWGRENPAFRQIFTTRLIPDGTPEQTRAFNELQRITCSPEVAVAMVRAMQQTDVAHVLPQLRVPTLVLHCRDDAMIPFEQGRQLAAAIPGSRFVALESRNHILLEGDPAYVRFLEEMSSFLRE
jgi:pimeloyl-ACP methyl ester carboxylesterase/DNA-binding winged helix-turn-helix (wHTH) protein